MAFAQGSGALLISGVVASVNASSPGPPNPLQERIDAASPGAVLEVGPGTYLGPLVIRRPVSLVGRGQPRIDGGGRGNVVTILGDDVTIRGFRITGSGADLTRDEAGIFIQGARARLESNVIDNALHGIYLKKAAEARIRGNGITGMTALPAAAGGPRAAAGSLELCVTAPRNINIRGNGVHLWNSSGAVLEENQITGSRDGIYFSFSSNCLVRGNRIRHVRYGLHYMYSDQNRFEHNHFSHSAAGAAMMYSKGLTVRGNLFEENRGFRAYGLLLSAVDQTRIEDNRFLSNRVGVYLENSNVNLFLGNTVAGNYIGIRLTASSDGNRFSRNRFQGNLHPAELAGLSETNRWSVSGAGNYWEGASPVDLDGDGVGELAYREADILGKLRDAFPLVGLLSGSPALELLEFAHRHVELPGLSSIKDPAPLVSAGPAPRVRPDD